MAAFPCPYCARDLIVDDDAKLERCPSCDGSLLIAYRHRLIAAHGKVSGGVLYEAVDDGFGEHVAVLFVDKPDDPVAVERFIEGNRLFADLGGRGLVKIQDIGTEGRPYVVMDWLTSGTLDRVIPKRGALPQPALLELVGDLLTGVGKAHRAMPAIVHGHIHPGKIGFRRKGEVVLFGFEWATKVNAQASRLADSFTESSGSNDKRSPQSDVRQLAAVFMYAATGEWLGELDIDRQRERVRARLPGPLGQLVDRMLGAGVDGYSSAVEAAIDFDQLMRGVDTWQVSARQQDRSTERMGTAWVDEAADEDDDDELEFEEIEPEPIRSTPAPASSQQVIQDWAAIVAQRQAEALAQAKAQTPANPGRTVLIAVVVMMMISTCVAWIIADAQPEPVSVVEYRPPPPRPEPIIAPPPPIELPEFPEHQSVPEPEPQPARSVVAGTFRYEGKVTGPLAFAGVGLGERCEVWVEPSTGGRLNCRWYIDCGTPRRRIYGGGTVGYSQCEVDDLGAPLRAQDEEDDAADGAFLAELGVDPPMIIFEDRWIEPPVRVIITIESGGPTTRLVPGTLHAPRLDREEIARRIARDEWPTVTTGLLGDW